MNCERLHAFADISSVEAFLAELSTREAGPLVQELPRSPGARENRWMHLLADESVEQSQRASQETLASSSEIAQLTARIDTLEQELASLKAIVLAGKPS